MIHPLLLFLSAVLADFTLLIPGWRTLHWLLLSDRRWCERHEQDNVRKTLHLKRAICPDQSELTESGRVEVSSVDVSSSFAPVYQGSRSQRPLTDRASTFERLDLRSQR
jgi:hypothetical protein